MNELLEYARRGKTSWWRWLATPVLAFVLGVLVDLLRDQVIAQHGVGLHALYALIRDPSQPAWFYGFGGLSCATFLLSLVLSALIVHNKQFSDIVGDWRWGRAATGAGIGLAFCVIGTAADAIVHPGGFRLILGPQTATLLLMAIPYGLLDSLFGEFLLRGYLTQGLLLASKRPLVVAVVVGVCSMLGANSWPHAAGDFAGGAAMALIAIRTGGIAFSWGMGAASVFFNAVVVVESDDVFHGSPGIFSQTTPDLAWFDVAVSCLLLAAIWLWVMRRYPVQAPTADIFA